jgi:hypothetical protein
VTAFEWTLTITLGGLYLTLLFTVAVVTYQKKHIALFVFGFVFPFCWLIGSMLKPKPGSNYHGSLLADSDCRAVSPPQTWIGP